MKLKNNLKTKIMLFFIIFSVAILSFLWLFQVIFLNNYYEHVKINDMNKIASQIKKNYQSDSFNDLMDNITFDKGVCIEIYSSGNQMYSSNSFSRGCLESNNDFSYHYKKEFIVSGDTSESYKIVNEKFHNKTLVHAMKLDNDFYVFINVSLEPLGWATNILASQLIYVTIIVLLLSIIMAYFISKKIAKPIVKLNETASHMAKGDYSKEFKIGEDIEELNELAHTLDKTRIELSNTEELRRDFLANVSHDLKTPLTMIKAYAEMVRDLSYKNKDKRNNHLNTIIEETDRLNLLVNDILDLSKMQANIEKLQYENFDIDLVIKNIIHSFNYLVEKDNYKFIYDGEEKQVYADKKKIEQVLYNLISNATEYVGKDKTVIINVIESDVVKIEIKDNGIGIKEEDLPLIWDRYYKINKNHKRETNSTGIGLSIVKTVLESHKVNYGVNSKKNKGTTFYFELEKPKK